MNDLTQAVTKLHSKSSESSTLLMAPFTVSGSQKDHKMSNIIGWLIVLMKLSMPSRSCRTTRFATIR